MLNHGIKGGPGVDFPIQQDLLSCILDFLSWPSSIDSIAE